MSQYPLPPSHTGVAGVTVCSAKPRLHSFLPMWHKHMWLHLFVYCQADPTHSNAHRSIEGAVSVRMRSSTPTMQKVSFDKGASGCVLLLPATCVEKKKKRQFSTQELVGRMFAQEHLQAWHWTGWRTSLSHQCQCFQIQTCRRPLPKDRKFSQLPCQGIKTRASIYYPVLTVNQHRSSSGHWAISFTLYSRTTAEHLHVLGRSICYPCLDCLGDIMAIIIPNPCAHCKCYYSVLMKRIG